MSDELGGAAFPDARTLLARHGLHAKKHFGQNFLVSDRAFRAIVDATVVGEDDWIVEIGAGLGTLTARLAQRAHEGKIIALERDPDMVGVLKAELGHLETVHIEACDALKYDLHMAARWRGDKITVCGNLPYHVAAPLIFKALDARADITKIIVMVQREMADRIVGKPDTDDYGAMTVMIQMFADVGMVAKVSAGSFVPAPKVDSAVVKIIPLPQPRHPIGSEPHFSRVVHAAFGQRRKTLRNSLRAQFAGDAVDAALAAVSIDGIRRGETLTLAEFAALSVAIPETAGLPVA
ncbi:MAG: 16S rRNA (adenine(1518)-N(6)/adenine(1519)-N(6))-dimethyltransferase RsmA [Deltaproteobacteria bacterium]|nr:16S rRNA (adenine(1518)-N(6)/adenine(1519)-N(6))-dimethyltransferase RsmA [Deltaproteobacteria bacterium]